MAESLADDHRSGRRWPGGPVRRKPCRAGAARKSSLAGRGIWRWRRWATRGREWPVPFADRRRCWPAGAAGGGAGLGRSVLVWRGRQSDGAHLAPRRMGSHPGALDAFSWPQPAGLAAGGDRPALACMPPPSPGCARCWRAARARSACCATARRLAELADWLAAQGFGPPRLIGAGGAWRPARTAARHHGRGLRSGRHRRSGGRGLAVDAGRPGLPRASGLPDELFRP